MDELVCLYFLFFHFFVFFISVDLDIFYLIYIKKMFNSNFEKRGEHVNTNASEQRRPSLKELWASNPSSSLHSLDPSYTDFRGKISFQSHSFEPPNNSAWVSNNFDHTQECPTTSNAWTPPQSDFIQSMEPTAPSYWDPHSSYSYPNQGYDHTHSYDSSNEQWAQNSSYQSFSHEPNNYEWETFSNSMNPSTPESEEEFMDRMTKSVQEFAKGQGILIEEDPPLDLTTHHFETPFQTSMPNSQTYSFNDLDNQETHVSHFNSFVNLIPDVVDDLSMGEPHIPMETNSFSTSISHLSPLYPQGRTTFMILLSLSNLTNLSPHLSLIHILISSKPTLRLNVMYFLNHPKSM